LPGLDQRLAVQRLARRYAHEVFVHERFDLLVVQHGREAAFGLLDEEVAHLALDLVDPEVRAVALALHFGTADLGVDALERCLRRLRIVVNDQEDVRELDCQALAN
jgi:hypothetical protein